MDVIEAIKNRKTARNFSNKKISPDDIREIIKAASHAPSGGNSQNWMFGIVDSPLLIDKLAKAAGNQMWIKTASTVIVLCTNIDYDRNDLPSDDFGLIVDQTRFGEDFVNYLNQYPDRHMTNIFWNNANPLIPGGYLLLAAQKYGIHGCFVGYMDILKVNLILDIPKEYTALYLMPLGYPIEDIEPKKRKDFEDIVFENTWGSKN